MSADVLLLISRVCYVAAAAFILMSVVFWYVFDIPGSFRELKEKKVTIKDVRRGNAPRESESRPESTAVLEAGSGIRILEDIVIVHGVSTRDQ